MQTRQNNSGRPISKMAVGAAKKRANQFSRSAEKVQLSMNKLQKEIQTLKNSPDPMASFALGRKQNELEVLQNNFGRFMAKHDEATKLLNEYTAHNNTLRNNGSN